MATETARGVLTIDLGALVGNYRRLQAAAAGSEVAGVVKADAYGLGIGPVASALWAAGCRQFFVAHPIEGVALRSLLPAATIYILHGLPAGTEGELLRNGLVPVLNQPAELARWRRQAADVGRPLPAALQLDSGMGRLGFGARDLAGLDETALAGLDLRLVMSHLACAEDPDQPLNQHQRQGFEAARQRWPGVPASLANSAGIFLGSAFHYQLCRPGIALYGVNPTLAAVNPMAPVVSLSAPVLQVHAIEAAGTIGYGATYPVDPGARIATLALGYADGYLRAAGGSAKARIGGTMLPLAGRVSMDLISVDVSSLPAEAVRPGTMAELIFGPDGVAELASAGGTIAYELLTRLGTRLARRYTRPAPGDEAG